MGVNATRSLRRFKACLFTVFENCFLFSKIRKTVKTYVWFAVFFLFFKYKQTLKTHKI